jgi:hypothetical protein
MNLSRLRILPSLLAVAFVMVGCGESRNLVPVRGRVTFGSGEPPQSGVIIFLPTDMPATVKDTGHDPRPGRATFESDGRFAANTFRAADGLRPGTYDVNVICISAPRDETAGRAEVVNHVPASFTAPRLVVPTDTRSAVEYNIDVPSAAGRR